MQLQIIALVTCLGQAAPALRAKRPELLSLGMHAYTYFYPLVLMDETRVQQLARSCRANAFTHATAFPTADNRTIVRPNVDTLYSVAWLDLSNGPMLMSVPDTAGRFYEMQMLDAWTNTFAAPGKRTTGTKAQDFLIIGPKHLPSNKYPCKSHYKNIQNSETGSLSSNMPNTNSLICIDAPTSTVLVLGRTQTNGPEDYDAVHKVQAGYTITPFNEARGPDLKLTAASSQATMPTTEREAKDPPTVVASLDAKAFFTRASVLMRTNPAPEADNTFLQSLAPLGIGAGKDFNFDGLGCAMQALLDLAVHKGKAKVAALPAVQAKFNGAGWSSLGSKVGSYGTDYRLREIIAVVGLFANVQEDAIYINLSHISGGEPLSADNTYTITFPAGNLPPVGAFWSVTVYDADGYLVKNSIGRYALHSWDDLEADPVDGSTTLVISAKPPGTRNSQANWLPLPANGKGEFDLTARFYWPDDAIINGSWVMPAVMKTGRVY